MTNDPVAEAEAIVQAQLQDVMALHVLQDAQLLLLCAAASAQEAQAWMLSRAAERGLAYASLVAASTVSVARTHFARFTGDPTSNILDHYVEHDEETKYPHNVAHDAVRGMLGTKSEMASALNVLKEFATSAPNAEVSWVLVHIVHVASELMQELFAAARKAILELPEEG